VHQTHPSHKLQNARILRQNLVTKMSPQMLILLKSSPKICHFLAEYCNFQKNIGFVADSMYVAFEHTLVAPFFFPHIDWHVVTRMSQNQKML
jgi:hypothetical protein